MEGSGVVGLCRHDRNERLPLEAILWRAFPSPLALVMVLPFHFLASALVRPPETVFFGGVADFLVKNASHRAGFGCAAKSIIPWAFFLVFRARFEKLLRFYPTWAPGHAAR